VCETYEWDKQQGGDWERMPRRRRPRRLRPWGTREIKEEVERQMFVADNSATVFEELSYVSETYEENTRQHGGHEE
jgi:hypothetical protein